MVNRDLGLRYLPMLYKLHFLRLAVKGKPGNRPALADALQSDTAIQRWSIRVSLLLNENEASHHVLPS
jgi:hypothetical protein